VVPVVVGQGDEGVAGVGGPGFTPAVGVGVAEQLIGAGVQCGRDVGAPVGATAAVQVPGPVSVSNGAQAAFAVDPLVAGPPHPGQPPL
jgi:hypothetical protein